MRWKAGRLIFFMGCKEFDFKINMDIGEVLVLECIKNGDLGLEMYMEHNCVEVVWTARSIPATLSVDLASALFIRWRDDRRHTSSTSFSNVHMID
jgi:hypothetical protein